MKTSLKYNNDVKIKKAAIVVRNIGVIIEMLIWVRMIIMWIWY